MKIMRINSQHVQKGDIFIGIPCSNLKNNVLDAVKKGATLIFVEKKYNDLFENEFNNIRTLPEPNISEEFTGAHVPQNRSVHIVHEDLRTGVTQKLPERCRLRKSPIVYVDDARLTASKLASFCYDSHPKYCVSVTGTNGKSSVVHFLKQIWQSSGKKASNLGTLGLFVADEKVETETLDIPALTTPDAISLHKTLEYLKNNDVTHFAFEASSHALDQKRLHSVPLKAAAFTNLASDHMDYHGTEEAYLNSKLKLFSEILPQENPAIASLDFPIIYNAVKRVHNKIITFGLTEGNFVRATNIEELSNRTAFDLTIGSDVFKNIAVNLFGGFQIMNVLCAIALAYSCDMDSSKIVKTLSKIKQLEGRMEYVCSHNGAFVYVDYAHTSEGFKNCLETFKRNCAGRLICVFGCGGDRDKAKRRGMGNIANQLSDIIVVTDDNPRNESPESIRSEILTNCKNAIEIADRKEAIKYAMNLLQKDDMLVVIGKGHEKTQIYKDKVIQHNDKDAILDIIH